MASTNARLTGTFDIDTACTIPNTGTAVSEITVGTNAGQTTDPSLAFGNAPLGSTGGAGEFEYTSAVLKCTNGLTADYEIRVNTGQWDTGQFFSPDTGDTIETTITLFRNSDPTPIGTDVITWTYPA